jgi:hypothetical protein
MGCSSSSVRENEDDKESRVVNRKNIDEHSEDDKISKRKGKAIKSTKTLKRQINNRDDNEIVDLKDINIVIDHSNQIDHMKLKGFNIIMNNQAKNFLNNGFKIFSNTNKISIFKNLFKPILSHIKRNENSSRNNLEQYSSNNNHHINSNYQNDEENSSSNERQKNRGVSKSLFQVIKNTCDNLVIDDENDNDNKFDSINIDNISLNSILKKKKYKYVGQLNNFEIKSFNHYACKVTKFFKDQKPGYTQDKKFKDPFFPPNNDSVLGQINGKPIDINVKRYNKNLEKLNINVNDIIWLSPSELFGGKNYSLFDDSIDIEDIMQGNLGNCYFLSALSSLSEFPQLICQIFRSFKINTEGYYEVTFFINGEAQNIIIDDYIPCNKKTKQPFFCKPRNNEIWVLLLEKAWAKVNGGYINTIGGHASESLKTLTPFCIKSYVNKEYSEDSLFKTILNADRLNYTLTSTSEFDDKIEKLGLNPSHSYTIISAFEEEVDNEVIRLLLIRNPWGFREWKGDWSDSSNKWTEKTRQIFKNSNENKDDGTFYIELSDYVKYFNETQICRIISPCCIKSIAIEEKRSFVGNVFEFALDKSSQVDISVVKESFRFNRSSTITNDITTNILLLERKSNSEYEVLKIEGCYENDCVLDAELLPGTYLIYFICSTPSITKCNLHLKIVSSNFFLLSDKGEDENFEFLKEVVSSKCSSIPAENGFIEITKNRISELSTIGMFYLKNSSGNNKTITLDVKLVNYKILDNDLEKYNFNQNSSTNTGKNKIKSSRTMISLKKDIGVVLNLKSEEEIIILGIIRNYFNEFWFNISFNDVTESKGLYDNIDAVKLTRDKNIDGEITSKFYTPSTNREFLIRPNVYYYDFIYKKIDLPISTLVNESSSITIMKEMEDYFKLKYPQFMNLIKRLKPKSTTDVKFMDLFDGDWGLGIGDWGLGPIPNPQSPIPNPRYSQE